MFELRGRFGVARQKVVKLIHGSEKENMVTCSSNGNSVNVQQENTLLHINHSVEAELEKAKALAYYRLMLNTPK